jgi:hypothetical protein
VTTNKLKPSPGPWTVGAPNKFGAEVRADVGTRPRVWANDKTGIADICIRRGIYEGTSNEEMANAQLIAEAGTVFHETGLSPRQLADQCRDMYAALLECEALVREYPFVLRQVRAAIAESDGKVP